MIRTINGKFGEALLFLTDGDNSIDPYALVQLKTLLDNPASLGSKIRIMPDVHPGKVCTIGLTMSVGEQILPQVLGIDIGCGITVCRVKGVRKEFQKLDTVIRERVPSGFSRRKSAHRFAPRFDFSSLSCRKHIREDVALLSLGTLGGGNHFIELDFDEESSDFYLAVHSGSRHLGSEITEYYMRAGAAALKEKGEVVPFELTYLCGDMKERYLSDVKAACDFASLNREIMIDEISKAMKWKIDEMFSSVHNYADFSFDCPILRKGAISAKAGERVIIPVNMKEGIIIGEGKGKADWNFSAPHGSGRILKREDVKKRFTVSSFKSEMKGIWASCVGKSTLDEAPFAYRSLCEIQSAIGESVDVKKIIRPVYSFKAGGEE